MTARGWAANGEEGRGLMTARGWGANGEEGRGLMI